jgi:outer membrane protein TolC
MYKLIFYCLFFFCSFVSFANNNEQRTLTFSQAAELAVLTSVDLNFSRSSQTIMEKVWLSGMREYFPRISISVSENDRLQQLGVDSFMKNYGISLDQLIFDGGRLSLSRRVERTELRLSSSRIDRMESDIAEAAISAYRNVLSSRAILEIKKKALGILEEQINILKEEVLLGLALPVDLANAQINLMDAKLDIYSLQLDLTEIERQFTELLGLKTLPVLTESVDINRATILPNISVAADLAKEQNPDLIEARFSVSKRRAELRYLSRSWIPTLRLNGNFGLSGQSYPLTRYNWSVGVNIDLSSPLIQNRFSANTGWEPVSTGQFDRTAMVQNIITPFNDPPSRYGRKQARLAYKLEQEKYNTALERIGRVASNAIEKCALAEQKRKLSLEAAAIGEERCRIEEIRLNLGQITRLKMMEVLIEQTQREIAVIEAAIYLLEAERELERFLDLEPGELAKLAILKLESIQGGKR